MSKKKRKRERKTRRYGKSLVLQIAASVIAAVSLVGNSVADDRSSPPGHTYVCVQASPNL